MDLTRLYNLTTPELREEAERAGVTDTYAMSRGQLIHAIRARAETPQQEGFLGKVFGFAKWALKAAGETSSGRSATPAEAEAGPAAVPGAATVPAAASVSATAPAPAPAPAAAPEAAPAAAPAAAAAGPAAAGPAAAGPASAGPAAAGPAAAGPAAVVPGVGVGGEADSGPPSRPPAGVFTSGGGLFDEPIPTLTMARILAEQGHFKRALAIYTRLIDDAPGDGELAAEANEVRVQARARRSHAPH